MVTLPDAQCVHRADKIRYDKALGGKSGPDFSPGLGRHGNRPGRAENLGLFFRLDSDDVGIARAGRKI